MCQFDVDPFGTIASASTYWICALFASWTSGWYSCWARAVPMALIPPKKGLRVSLLPPPVRPTLRLPPLFGGEALPPGDVDVDVDDEQASSRPPPARAAPPSTAERRNVRRPRLGAASSLSGRGVVLISASLLLSALRPEQDLGGVGTPRVCLRPCPCGEIPRARGAPHAGSPIVTRWMVS